MRRRAGGAEFQQQMVRLVRAGRTAEELGEFEPLDPELVRQAELDEGQRTDALKSKEREELAHWVVRTRG